MLTKETIKEELSVLGLGAGDIVLVHSAVAHIGKLEGGVDTLLDAFLEILGPSGTLAVPVFGNLGIFTQTVKQHPRAVISDSPHGRIAAIGGEAELICLDHLQAPTAHGVGTPYLKIADLGGYICLLGVDQDRNTTLHSVEALLELPYLRQVQAEVETAVGKINKTWQYFPGPHRDFIGLDRRLRDSGKMNIGKVGGAVTRLIKSRDLIDLMLEEGAADPAFCLCDNPECADCVRQRSMLFSHRLNKEDFKLTIAASVAGRYVPEIIDNLCRAGCDYVELDALEGRSAFKTAPEQLTAAVATFKAAGIQVSALRMPATPLDISRVLQLLQAAGITRLIMPLTSEAPVFSARAAEQGIKADFVNMGIAGAYADAILSSMTVPSLVFNPAEFARAGEKPFLETFRYGKLRRQIVQLDIEDGRFDGLCTPWARGNGEVKELVSILRCGSFGGFMSITARNREWQSGALPLTETLFKLLREI